MSLSTTGRTWDEASSPAAQGLTRRFEAAWRRAQGDPSSRPPDLAAFLAGAEAGDDSAAGPGARLALIRTEMGLRWEAGERVGVAHYRRRFPDLGGDTLVALVYEEFCLREEAGLAPDPAEYLSRYAEVSGALRRVLDIHGLVGAPTASTTASLSPASAVLFPRAGETIAGFRLVEELGRGAFARVFRAEERQLADRPVALKVARSGSREPQTLARLQHTHIVPIHSYRTDPATGLHLLCMPYFGRVTLAHLLADGRVRSARTGAELVDALDRLGAGEHAPTGRSPGRAALARRNYPRAVAWWGARMAEALDHAHGHGVLHRDIKPSNVLVTRDGLPMLLDFNLAREVVLAPEEADRALPGGTLDYMAPEQIDELSEGVSERVDARSDVYGLGVVLYEALAGARPFVTPRDAETVHAMLAGALADRREGPPGLASARPDVPAALAAVVARCLAPDPDARYASAGELAVDLQAVADDRPPVRAREPLSDRARRWARDHQRLLVTAVPVALALVAIASLVVRERAERTRTWSDANSLYEAARAAEEDDDYARAMSYYEAAARLAERPGSQSLPREIKRRLVSLRDGLLPAVVADLDGLRNEARLRFRTAELTRKVRDDADRVTATADALRFRLTGFGGDLPAATEELHQILAPFFVFEQGNWLRRPDLELLGDPRRPRLVAEVNELLFLWALALDRDADPRPGDPTPDPAARARVAEALRVCDRALEFATPTGPWAELRERLRLHLARLAGEPEPEPEPEAPTPDPRGDALASAGDSWPPDELGALGYFQWGALRLRQGRPAEAVACFRRAVRLEPGNYWYQYYLAYTYDTTGADLSEALRHYDVAVALKPQSPWVRFSRARLYRVRGALQPAKEDLGLALDAFPGLPESSRDAGFERQARLELGLVLQSLGDLAEARKEYARLVGPDGTGRYAWAARLNLAKLDADSGSPAAARAGYDALVAEKPGDREARLGRALLALRQGRPADAEADLGVALAAVGPPVARADALAFRALARLVLQRPAEALADAEAARRLRPDPWRERLRTRALLALGRTDELTLTAPDELARLPLNGAPLRDDLRRLVETLSHPADEDTVRVGSLQNLAVACSALGEHSAAAEAADRAVAGAPQSPRPYLVRARVNMNAGRWATAAADVERARALDPDDPRVWELRGRLQCRSGHPAAARADLDRALALGAGGAPLYAPRAAARLALGDSRGAVEDWTRALEHDPEDPAAYLGRSRAFAALRQWDASLADLEAAAAWSEGRPDLRIRIALAYLRCLPRNPSHLPRLAAILRRALATPLS